MATADPSVESLSRQSSTGPAHVAVVSFLASRLTPTGGFWIALAGGVALARVAERRGARQGYGASIAAMLETLAIIGPSRFNVPFTQALTAPLLGRLEARGVSVSLQIAVCGLLRMLQNAATSAFLIWVITGLDAYAGTYETIGRRLGLDVGTADTLIVTAAGLAVWAVFASTVQVHVYRRGLRRWDAEEAGLQRPAPAEGEPAVAVPPVHVTPLDTISPDAERRDDASPAAVRDADQAGDAIAPNASRPRFDPRAVVLAAIVAFAVLLASTSWVVLGAVSVALVLAWVLSRPDPAPLAAGLAFTALLAGSAFFFSLVGGLGLEVALRRGLRAALLVLVATWMRAAARAEGLRTVMRGALGRLRRLPAAREAATVLDSLESERRLAASARAVATALRDVPLRPLPFVDAVLAWVVREAAPRQSGVRAETRRL